MHRHSFESVRNVRRVFASGVLMTLLGCPALRSQSIPNPSFESNTFSVAPGYIGDNTAITGWTADYDFGAGLDPAGGTSQFAASGAVPDGKNVAYLLGGTTLSTTITGLTSGTTYQVTFQAGAPTGQTATLRAMVDGVETLGVTVYPAGEGRPYGYLSFEFTAAASSASLNLYSEAAFEAALLVDNFKVAPSTGKWTVSQWTDDASSGVDASYVYTHAYNFGSSANVTLNGVLFKGAAGANPKVTDQFSTVLFGNVFNNDANNVTGSGGALAKDFIYSGADVTAGTSQTIALTGLTPGTDYVATVYSVAFDAPTPAMRWATMSVGNERLTFNQDTFGNDEGIRVSCRYTADATGTAEIHLAPVNPVNVSIHVYGFSNREAISRNAAPAVSLQPMGTTVAQGLPVELSVAASGFPAPTYQWRLNGAAIAGATAADYRIASTSSASAGLYDVVVANSVGSVTSAVARVTIGLPMQNASFEADSFEAWPGYSGENPGSATTPSGPNTPITGWVQSDEAGSGINPIATGESPFADNGTVPNGKQVCFLQSDGSLGQTMSGLTVGANYYLHYYENSRTTVTPSLQVNLDGTSLIAEHAVPYVGGNSPYREVFSDMFVAQATSAEVTFVKSNPLGGDSTALIDNVAIVQVPAGTAPTILRSPVGGQLNIGQTNTFSVQFIGSLPVTYQWLKNGSPIAGATGATLTLSQIQASDEGEYSVTVGNSGGAATSEVARVSVVGLIPGVFGTGMAADGTLLAAGETDPHYTLSESADLDYPGPDAIVVNDAWPVQAGVWALNGPDSKWIAPQADQGTGNAEGDYAYTTTFDLTGYDVSQVQLVGGWAVDNSGTDIVLNGASLGLTVSGFADLTPFTISSGLVAGKNTLVFKVANLPATPNPTALRVDLKGIMIPTPVAPAKLQVSRNGTSVSVSWSVSPAGQKLQSAPSVTGPWTDVPGASNPYTVQATASALFFRTVK